MPSDAELEELGVNVGSFYEDCSSEALLEVIAEATLLCCSSEYSVRFQEARASEARRVLRERGVLT